MNQVTAWGHLTRTAATEDKALSTEALSLSEQAKAIKVIDVATAERAGAFRKLLKEMENKIVAHYKPMKQAQDAAKKVILDQEQIDLTPVQLADGLLKTELSAFLNAEEKKRLAEEARLQKEADAKAEKERESLLNRAANAKTEEKQEELLEKAENVYTAPVVVEHTISAPIAGVTRRKDTFVTVTDDFAFLTELVAAKNVLTMIEIKPGPLKAWVKANRVKNFPGLHIEEKYV